MTTLSPKKWYALLAMRYLLALGMGWIGVGFIWRLPVPFWVRVLVEVIVINGLLVGALVVGPLTHKGYLAEQQRLEEARRAAERSNWTP